MDQRGLHYWVLVCVMTLLLGVSPAAAAPNVTFNITSEDEDLTADLQSASLVAGAVDRGETGSSDLVSAALADYRRLTETLYAFGYYSGSVFVRVNGQEVASLSLLSLPEQITSIEISVNPGPPFRFGQTRVAPLAPGETPSNEFAAGQPALATVIQSTSRAAVVGWRKAGYAKAEQGAQRIVADHRTNTLSADLTIIPGPKLRFGDLIITGDSAVRADRLAEIADLPSGEVYSPDTMATVAKRLRRTATFASVSLREADAEPDGTMDVELTVVDLKPRRFGFGAELSSFEGVSLTGFWLHRNLFGGAERLRFDTEIRQIAAQDNNGMDFLVRARLEFPALLRSDTTFFLVGQIESLDEPTYRSDSLEIGAGVTWFARDGVEAEIGVSLLRFEAQFALGRINYNTLTIPAVITWDARDDPLNATRGYYVRAAATPYLGFSGTASGMQLLADARGYRSPGSGRVTFAGRLQWGSILGSDLIETNPDLLFLSGGGGTVRGQPYQSLGIPLAPGVLIGGRSFLGTMLELRTNFTDTIGGVVFTDAGYVGTGSFLDGSGEWHAGAGVGVRYNTGIGPLRVDIAAPVSGNTGQGLQIYIGIGQAF